MKKETKTILGVVSFALLIIIAVLAYNGLSKNFKPQTPFDIVENQQGDISKKENLVPAKDFTAYDSDGNNVKLSNYFGKPIVLNFWASWCPPCKSEMPHFNKVYNDVKDDVVFLMVDLVDGSQETEEKGKKYIANNGFTFPVLFDLDQDAAVTYGIISIPTTLFIDKDGVIKKTFEGAISEEILLKGIDLIR